MTNANSGRKIVIGITGLKAAGKDEASRYLIELGFANRSCGDEIRDQLKGEGIAKPTVDQQIELGNRARQESGDLGYWAKRVAETLRARNHDRFCVNGLRHPEEVRALRAEFGADFVPIGLVAPTAIRAARLIARARPGDPTTIEQFLALDDHDRGIGQPWHGQQVDRTLACCAWHHVRDNCGTVEELRAWIDGILAEMAVRK